MEHARPNLELARKILSDEASYIGALAERIDERFARAAEAVYRCGGTVILTGIGKPGIIAQKISSTLASTGTPSSFLHPVDAVHGDLGRVRRGDVAVILSNSGTTEEILRLVVHLRARGAFLVAITSSPDSPLGQYADVALCYGQVSEVCPLGLAPSATTSCMLALGDALALTVMDMRKISPEDFAATHPGGELSRQLVRVEEIMSFRKDERLPVAGEDESLREVLVAAEKIPRRAGAVLLVDSSGKLSGIITDADFRRSLVADVAGNVLDAPAGSIMHRDPKYVRVGESVSHALAIVNQYRIDELPVVDAEGRPVGLLDVQDLVGLKAFGHGEE